MPKKKKPETTPPSRKKAYQTPRLVEYGDLRRIVMAVGKGSNRADAPSPLATKR